MGSTRQDAGGDRLPQAGEPEGKPVILGGRRNGDIGDGEAGSAKPAEKSVAAGIPGAGVSGPFQLEQQGAQRDHFAGHEDRAVAVSQPDPDGAGNRCAVQTGGANVDPLPGRQLVDGRDFAGDDDGAIGNFRQRRLGCGSKLRAGEADGGA